MFEDHGSLTVLALCGTKTRIIELNILYVLHFYCYITNYHEFSSLKQLIFIISQFSRVRSSPRLCKATIKVLTSILFLS